jgi:hypothetical protein
MASAVRFVAVLASLVVAVAAATLPTAFGTVHADVDATIGSQDRDAHEHDGRPGEDATSESSSDDDLDERLDDLDEADELLAVFEATAHTFVSVARETSWHPHTPRSPRAPHPEDTLRPPIAV